jgi:alpha-tubulin suppressor-like RCC1 family protein
MNGKTIVDFSVGGTALLALTNDGLVYSSDTSNGVYQAGDGTLVSHQAFALATAFNSAKGCGETIVNVHGGGYNSMVTTSYGRLLIVGSNSVSVHLMLTS